jgi:hypothetical protein
MRKAKRAVQKEKLLQPPRSPKAGRAPRAPAAAPQVRRRQRTAHAAFKKDTMILEAAEGPRVLWGVTKLKVKKG